MRISDWSSDVCSSDLADRGTSVTLYLRDDENEFLDGWKLREVLRRYSDHISLPIQMLKEEWDSEKSEQVKKNEWETVNQTNALWTRAKSDITDEQYPEFYNHFAHATQKPLEWTQNRKSQARRVRKGVGPQYQTQRRH